MAAGRPGIKRPATSPPPKEQTTSTMATNAIRIIFKGLFIKDASAQMIANITLSALTYYEIVPTACKKTIRWKIEEKEDQSNRCPVTEIVRPRLYAN
jgi:hypothetical protein